MHKNGGQGFTLDLIHLAVVRGAAMVNLAGAMVAQNARPRGAGRDARLHAEPNLFMHTAVGVLFHAPCYTAGSIYDITLLPFHSFFVVYASIENIFRIGAYLRFLCAFAIILLAANMAPMPELPGGASSMTGACCPFPNSSMVSISHLGRFWREDSVVWLRGIPSPHDFKF